MGRQSHLAFRRDPDFSAQSPVVGLRGWLAAIAGIVALLAPAAAASPTSGNLRSESAAMAVNLATGRILFARNADVSLEPASNEKLMVTYGGLTELGPGHRVRAVVVGPG